MKSSYYLENDVSAEFFIPNSVVSGIVLSTSIGASVAANTSPITSALVISQMQTMSTFSMFNVNSPDNFVGFSKGLNFQSTMKLSRSRLLSASSFVPLQRLGYYENTFIENQTFFVILIAVIVVTHLIVSLVRHGLERSK